MDAKLGPTGDRPHYTEQLAGAVLSGKLRWIYCARFYVKPLGLVLQ